MKGNAQRGAQLAFGSFGIKAMESTWITGRQIEAARQAIVRYMKREGPPAASSSKPKACPWPLRRKRSAWVPRSFRLPPSSL